MHSSFPLSLLAILLVAARTAPAQTGRAQSRDSALLARLDAVVEAAVVNGDTLALDTLYAPDLRFTHSTGEIEGRGAWLQRAREEPRPYRSRTVDSVSVELHGPFALTSGRLTVVPAGQTGYIVRYVRLYTKRVGRWLLVSHRSVSLQDLQAHSP